MIRAIDYLPLPLLRDANVDGGKASNGGLQIGDAVISPEDEWHDSSSLPIFSLLNADGSLLDSEKYPKLSLIYETDLALEFTLRSEYDTQVVLSQSQYERTDVGLLPIDGNWQRLTDPNYATRYQNAIAGDNFKHATGTDRRIYAIPQYDITEHMESGIMVESWCDVGSGWTFSATVVLYSVGVPVRYFRITYSGSTGSYDINTSTDNSTWTEIVAKLIGGYVGRTLFKVVDNKALGSLQGTLWDYTIAEEFDAIKVESSANSWGVYNPRSITISRALTEQEYKTLPVLLTETGSPFPYKIVADYYKE